MPEPAGTTPLLSWRDRRRSRLAEVADGGAMMYADVAVVRASVLAAVMLAVAFLARHRSGFAVALAVAAGAFLFAEMINTLVEMLVDRISLEANAFSARIKHAAAFVSACVGLVSVALLAAVAFQLWCGGGGGGGGGDGAGLRGPAGEGGPGDGHQAEGAAAAAQNAAARAENAARAAVGAARAALAAQAERTGLRGPEGARFSEWPEPGTGWASPRPGEGGSAVPAGAEYAAPSRRTAAEPAAEPAAQPAEPAPAAEAAEPTPAAIEPDFLTRWARSTAAAPARRQFSSRRIVHPLQWEARTRLKKRYRRRRV
jgi:diacylglycerol kinase